jgi:transcription initiation factor TFIID subunit TAF12
MSETPSQRRLAENEAIFRQINEQIQTGYDETNRLAEEDNQPQFKVSPAFSDTTLQFYCECADENCAKRISITLREYTEIHKDRNQFIIVPGHQVPSVERVVREQANYTIVAKKVDPPDTPETLHPTSVDNA